MNYQTAISRPLVSPLLSQNQALRSCIRLPAMTMHSAASPLHPAHDTYRIAQPDPSACSIRNGLSLAFILGEQ